MSTISTQRTFGKPDWILKLSDSSGRKCALRYLHWRLAYCPEAKVQLLQFDQFMDGATNVNVFTIFISTSFYMFCLVGTPGDKMEEEEFMASEYI